jgi:hypothetical protein
MTDLIWILAAAPCLIFIKKRNIFVFSKRSKRTPRSKPPGISGTPIPLAFFLFGLDAALHRRPHLFEERNTRATVQRA